MRIKSKFIIFIINQFYIKEMNHIKSMCKDPNKVQQKIQNKQFLLGKYFDIKKSCNRCTKDKKFTQSKRQKLLHIQQKLISQEHQSLIQSKRMYDQNQISQQKQQKAVQKPRYTYEFFLPLHNLWKCYMNDLIEQEKNQQSVGLKLLRSDFVGAQIQVAYSKIQSYIGQKGIIIKQSLKTFVVIKQTSHKIITLLKSEIIFKFNAAQRCYLLNGNTLTYRPSDRSKHKFKFRYAEKLNLNFLDYFMNDSQKQEQ